MCDLKVTQCLFLAAGLGARLQPYTLQQPKPMIPFLGLPLLYHAMDFLSQYSDVKKAILNVHHLSPMLLNFLSQNQVTLPIKNYEISDESDQILNSGGAVAKCEPLLSQEKGFWIFNTDEVIFPLKEEFNLRLLVASHQETNSLATLLVTQNDLVGTKFGGAWANSDNQVMRFSKTSQPGLKGWHYVGLMLLSSKIFQYVSKPTRPENILYDVLTTAISMGERVQVFPESLFWMETGVLEEFKINQQKMQQEIQSQSVIGRLMHERLNRYPKFPDVVG